MQYGLGRWLRNRYGTLVGPAWVSGELSVLSTDVDRTLMSAACNLASFYYPKETNERFEADLPWVPTPIHTVPLAYDKVCFYYKVLEEDLYLLMFLRCT